jgi:hypothetical protein
MPRAALPSAAQFAAELEPEQDELHSAPYLLLSQAVHVPSSCSNNNQQAPSSDLRAHTNPPQIR